MRFDETAASEIDLESLPKGNVTFVKLADLEEVEFVIVDARIVPSKFNEKNMTAQVTLVYPDQDEDDMPLQFSSEQAAIKKQVGLMQEGQFPIEGVTVRSYGEKNYYGNYSYCLAAAIPEIVQSSKTPIVDRSEDAKRQALSSRPIGRPSPKAR